MNRSLSEILDEIDEQASEYDDINLTHVKKQIRKEKEMKEFYFDELPDTIQDKVIEWFLKNDDGVIEYVIETAKHYKFDKDGNIIDNYDDGYIDTNE